MANKRATTYLVSNNDDLQTMVKKINSAFRNLHQDITHTNVIHQGGGGIEKHHELPDTATPDCHPMLSITGLTTTLSSINTKLNTISTSIDAINEILDDHEERIKKLEED